jgi:hypothetical protein
MQVKKKKQNPSEPEHTHLGRSAGYWVQMFADEADLVLYPLSKTLFDPVLDCILFYLVALIPRYIRQK